MDRVILQNGKTVGYYANELPQETDITDDYSVLTVPAGENKSAFELHKNGFVFAERSILMEIPLANFRLRANGGSKFNFILHEQWQPKELYNIAMESFDYDCRFAVDLDKKDKQLKNELLQNFIEKLKSTNCLSTCCYRDGKIIGFNIWYIKEQRGRVILGAMSNKYKGTGIALYLYLHTIQYMKEKRASVLGDTVFSSNTSAMNLHSMLAANTGGGGVYQVWEI